MRKFVKNTIIGSATLAAPNNSDVILLDLAIPKKYKIVSLGSVDSGGTNYILKFTVDGVLVPQISTYYGINYYMPLASANLLGRSYGYTGTIANLFISTLKVQANLNGRAGSVTVYWIIDEYY